MLGMHMGRVPAACVWEEAADAPRRHDTCDWLEWINLASVAANIEAGLLEKPLGAKIAAAIEELSGEMRAPGAQRPELYIQYEPELLRKAGMEASILHVGRSSQDILATANAGLNIERLLRMLAAAREAAAALIRTARREIDAVVPAYTNGVQAQPTLFSHTLHASALAFYRDCDRIRECIRRFDVCPMGSCVCNGTGWPLGTERMAKLLGFSRAAANAFDAGQIRGNDLPLEMSQIGTQLMVHVNAFLAGFMTQYASPRPWIRIGSTNGVYRSSAMPQKRNPGLINDCRRDAGQVMGEAMGILMREQNLELGMADARDVRLMEAFADDVCVVLRTFAGIVDSLQVDRERALEELNADWTASQEVADRLVREGGIDFRSAHRFMSRLVSWARESGLRPLDVRFDDAARLWAAFVSVPENASVRLPAALPLSPESLAAALNPIGILNARATPGSAHPDKVRRMLDQTESDDAVLVMEIRFLRARLAETPERLKAAVAQALAA